MRACTLMAAFLTLGIIQTNTHAGEMELTWSTIDGGGGYSAGDAFELEGTIGQPDAGAMAGGDFVLIGGFWAAAVPSCSCLGDMNGDGLKDGGDIQKFVNCVIAGGSCACADVDTLNGVTLDDVDVFVEDLLNGPACP